MRRGDQEAGVPPAQLSALSVLVFGGPRTLGELAAAEQVRPPTMTRVAQSLETAGLVRRTRDAQDRRVVRVAATARGRRIMRAGRARRIDELAALLERLPDADIRQIREAADSIERALAQQP